MVLFVEREHGETVKGGNGQADICSWLTAGPLASQEGLRRAPVSPNPLPRRGRPVTSQPQPVVDGRGDVLACNETRFVSSSE